MATRRARRCSGRSITPRRGWTSGAITSRCELLQTDGAVTGVLVLNDDGLGIVHAPSVILATGGLGHLYTATTNPEGSTGDGVALAMWAGLPVSDLEFIQFHPTMLFDGDAGGRRPLITEAVRGEGAILIDRAREFGDRRRASDG